MTIPEFMRTLMLTGHDGLDNADVNTRSDWYSKAASEATTGSAHARVFPRIQRATDC